MGGFIGLLGIYDDKPGWVKVFNYWMLVKLISIVLTFIADYRMLELCDTWLENPNYRVAGNVQMDKLAEEGVCPWARIAYIIGCSVDFSVWVYFTWITFAYQSALELNPPYSIDFGKERYDKEGRWKFY